MYLIGTGMSIQEDVWIFSRKRESEEFLLLNLIRLAMDNVLGAFVGIVFFYMRILSPQVVWSLARYDCQRFF